MSLVQQAVIRCETNVRLLWRFIFWCFCASFVFCLS